jgi:hypothetical protein
MTRALRAVNWIPTVFKWRTSQTKEQRKVQHDES